jgi:hypothetical protein
VESARTETSLQLRFVGRQGGGDGFDFQDYFLCNNDVSLEFVADWLGPVDDRDWDLDLERNG